MEKNHWKTTWLMGFKHHQKIIYGLEMMDLPELPDQDLCRVQMANLLRIENHFHTHTWEDSFKKWTMFKKTCVFKYQRETLDKKRETQDFELETRVTRVARNSSTHFPDGSLCGEQLLVGAACWYSLPMKTMDLFHDDLE